MVSRRRGLLPGQFVSGIVGECGGEGGGGGGVSGFCMGDVWKACGRLVDGGLGGGALALRQLRVGVAHFPHRSLAGASAPNLALRASDMRS